MLGPPDAATPLLAPIEGRSSAALVSPRQLSFDTHGSSGPLIVMLHGIPGWRGTFSAVASGLSSSFRVIVPDLLGFGDSPDAPPGHHAAGHAQAVEGLLAGLGVDDLHLVGFDFGGPTAVRLAASLGKRVRSLTLSATNLFGDTPVPLPLQIARVPLLGDAFYRVAFSLPGLLAMWLAATGDRRAFPLSRYRASLRGSCARTTRQIFLASMRDLPGLYADIERLARAFEGPSLVLWGDRDPFFAVSVGERTAALLGAELKVLGGCGHFVPEERAGEMAEAIAALVGASEAGATRGARGVLTGEGRGR